MKKLLLTIQLLLPLFCLAQNSGGKMYDMIIGTRTRGTSDGIYVYRFDAETGKISPLNHVAGIVDPTFLCISSNKKFIYAVNEDVAKPGSVYAYKFDAASGALTPINNQPAFGDALYVSVDREQQNLFVANYLAGHLAVYPINADGSLNPASQVLHDEGSGPDTSRQKGPHVHTAYLTHDEKFVLYTDLGTDKLSVALYDPSKKQPLTPAPVPFVNAPPGSGPRHIDQSADGKYVYMLQEMAGAITTYRFDKGRLTPLQIISMLPANFKGSTQAADIHLSPDGRFIYASNRGSANEIVQFAVDAKTGKLTFVDRYSSLGKSPRNFVIDPTGNFLITSNQYSSHMGFYKIDKSTGRLILSPTSLTIDGPMCVRFAAVE